VRALEQLGASTEEVVEYVERQAEELDLRVVLADARGFVFLDAEDALVGRQLRIDREAPFGLQRRERAAPSRSACRRERSSRSTTVARRSRPTTSRGSSSGYTR
jgi:hypothetical protein